MTGTEKIKTKIIEDARAKALAINQQAGQEASDIISQASKEAEQKKAELLKKAEIDAAQTYKRMLAVAGLEGRKEILRAKQDMIDAAFDAALSKVCSLPDKEYQMLLERMITDAAGDEGGEILLSQKDAKRMDDSFICNINKRLGSAGKRGTVFLSEQNIAAVGGFKLKRGEMEINGTLEIVFGMLRPELEQEVVKILFDA